MKKLMVFLMCTTMVLAIAGCGEKEPAQVPASSNSAEGSVQIPNPIVEEEDLDKAAEKLGFSLTLPEGFEVSAVRTINGELLDVTAAKEELSISVRKAKGSEDVSGDYNQYAEEKQVLLSEGDSIVLEEADSASNVVENEKMVTLKGAEGKMSLAVWTDGEFAYAVHCEGMDWETLCDLVNQIK